MPGSVAGHGFLGDKPWRKKDFQFCGEKCYTLDILMMR